MDDAATHTGAAGIQDDAIGGAQLQRLDEDDCGSLLAWMTQPQAAMPDGRLAATRWLLATLDDGVVWARRGDDGAWESSSERFPSVSPWLRRQALWEARVFGGDCEALIWRDAEDRLAGRLIVDNFEGLPDWLQPLDDQRVLRGDRILDGPADGFTVIGDRAGNRHAAPVELSEIPKNAPKAWPLRLRLRHFFTQDRSTGAVTVAATRCVDLVNRLDGGTR